VPAELDARYASHVLGAQGQLWTEYIATPKQAEYMAFPRACALAEVVWSPADAKNFGDFLQRLNVHGRRLAILDVNYRVPSPAVVTAVR
jgi:hexosaminidase